MAPSGALRVALVTGDLRPELDGVADAVVQLAGALRDEGAEVRIVHAGRAAAVRGARSAATAWGPVALLRAARALRAADVVHVQFAPSAYRFRAWIGLLPLVLGRTPLVVTAHEYGWWTAVPRIPRPLARLLERRRILDGETLLLVPRSRAVVVTNAAHEQAVRGRFPAARTVRIPIGSNVRAVPPERSPDPARLRSRLGLPARAAVVAFFGFVHPVKGVRYLVDAVAALRAEGRDLHLLVLGGFESLALPAGEAAAFEAELRAHVAGAGMTAHTTVTGYLAPAEVAARLACSDLAALPFTAGVTAKSGSLLTVLGHGLPTVVTAPPEPEPELVDGLDCVVVSPVRDAAAVADGLRRLLDDPALAERVREGGLELARSRGWDRIARAHLDLYRSVLP